MYKKIMGMAVSILVLGGATASAQEPEAAPEASTDTPIMQQVHEGCVPIAIQHFNDPAKYAENVPAGSQGRLAATAAENGVELSVALNDILSNLLINVDGQAWIRIFDSWQGAAEPVGEANTSEYGFLTGTYQACVFASIELPESSSQAFLESPEGKATWNLGTDYFELAWGPDRTDDSFMVTVHQVPAPAAATATTQPAPTTQLTLPSTSAPTTGPAQTPTTTTGQSAATPLPLAPAPALDVPTGGSISPDQGILATRCHNGDMTACDELFKSTVDADKHHCWARGIQQVCRHLRWSSGASSGDWCVEAFTSNVAAPPGPGTADAGAPVDTIPAAPAPVPADVPVESTPAGGAPPTTMDENVMLGVGSGTATAHLACPVLTYNDWDTNTCLPTSSPAPQGTVAMNTDADCPITGDLEHPDPEDPTVFTFTVSSDMKTLVECSARCFGLDDVGVCRY